MISVLVGWERRERREEHDASLGEESTESCESDLCGSWGDGENAWAFGGVPGRDGTKFGMYAMVGSLNFVGD